MTAPPLAKLCSVYANAGWLLVVCNHQAPSWIWKAGHPIVKLSRDSDTELVGTNVLAILARSTQGRVADSPEIDNTVPSFAGFRSWRAFASQTVSVSVRSDGAQVTVTPSRRNAKGAFYPLSQNEITCSSEPDDVGTAVLQALERCS